MFLISLGWSEERGRASSTWNSSGIVVGSPQVCSTYTGGKGARVGAEAAEVKRLTGAREEHGARSAESCV